MIIENCLILELNSGPLSNMLAQKDLEKNEMMERVERLPISVEILICIGGEVILIPNSARLMPCSDLWS